MKKSDIITILFLASSFCLKAQTSVSFQHLGNATFQNNLINPSLIPEGKLFIGLPLISGIHMNVNSKLNYKEIFTKRGDRNIVDIKGKVLGRLQNQNLLSVELNINLFHLGYRLNSGSLLSFTVNERIEGDFLFSKQLVDYIFNGNVNYLNQDVKVSKAGGSFSYFREYGLGFATSINDQLTIGVRGKYLNGFVNVSTPGNAKATLRSSGEAYQLSAEWKNAQFRTSGLDINDNDLASHLIMNENHGVALDLGGTYRLNGFYTLTGSILDVGFINWKENIDNQVLGDTTFEYNGVNLEELGNIRETLEDSLFNKFKSRSNTDAYRSWLPVRAHGSWIYHYRPKTDIYVTVGSKYLHRQFKLLYGAGVTHQFRKSFTGSISVTRLPQQFFNLGMAITVKGGPAQMYLAADHIINFSVPDAKAFDFRFGINFIFGEFGQSSRWGQSSKSSIGGAKGLDTNIFLGKKIKTRSHEGIYSIITRQKQRKLKETTTKKKNRVQKKSLTGRRKRKNPGNK